MTVRCTSFLTHYTRDLQIYTNWHKQSTVPYDRPKASPMDQLNIISTKI